MPDARTALARRLILAAVSAGTALAFSELAIRWFAPAPPVKAIDIAAPDCVYRRSANPLLGFELKHDYRNTAPDFIESYERTNNFGQRDRDWALAKPSGSRRILLLGDSVVEGYGLPETATMSWAMTERFEEIGDTSTEVLNFGVSAYCTLAEVELLRTKGLEFDPDVVVLVFVENDFDNFNREAFPLGGTIERPAIAETLFKASHVFRQLCFATDWFQFASEARPVEWNSEAIGNNNVVAGLEQFASLAREHGFQPLIAIWPRFADDKIEDVHFVDAAKQTLIVEALAWENGIPSFRLSEAFRADLETRVGATRPRLTYSQGDRLHPNELGAKVAATAIVERLREPLATPQRQVTGRAAADAAMQLGSTQPNYARVENRLGDRLFKQGRHKEAIAHYQRALDQDPANAVAHNNWGVALEKAGIEGAKDHFIEAVKSQPDFALAHYNLSRALLNEGKSRGAIAGLQQTLRFDPNHVGALNLLGREMAKLGQFDESLQLLGRANQLDPDNPSVLNNLGVVCQATGQRDRAIQFFEAVLALDNTHTQAAQNLHALRRDD